ncbi:MAG: signal peptidase II [Candidatus Promineifilaceae bacterium]|nr:signal peptidase II [Candidatus Promineifilaceae bacterium]
MERREVDVEEPIARRERPAPPWQPLMLFLVAVAVILVDHLTKLAIESTLPLNHSVAPFPEIAHLFRLTHVSNTGAAFGLFQGASPIFIVIALVVGIVIIFYNYTLPAGHMLLRVALGLQLGGAFGNLIDRIRLGHVTDFLDFGPWPVFNLADAAVVAGVIILGYLMLQEEAAERVAQAAERKEALEGEPEQTQQSHLARAHLSPRHLSEVNPSPKNE